MGTKNVKRDAAKQLADFLLPLLKTPHRQKSVEETLTSTGLEVRKEPMTNSFCESLVKPTTCSELRKLNRYQFFTVHCEELPNEETAFYFTFYYGELSHGQIIRWHLLDYKY